MFMRPQTERNRRRVIDQRNGVAVFRQIDRGEKKLAGIAGFHANVRQLLRDVDWKLTFRLFAARGAQDAAEFPLLRTKRTQQESFPAIAFRAQHSREWPRAAHGTNPHGHHHGSPWHQSGAKLGIRLQKRTREELRECADLLVVLAAMFPVRFEAGDPGIRRQQRHLMRCLAQRRWGVLFDRGEKSPEVGKKHSEVERSAQPSYGRAAGFHSTRSRDAGANRFLKRGDVLIEIEEFRGEKVLRSKPLGALDSRIVVGPTGLCSRSHLINTSVGLKNFPQGLKPNYSAL